MTTLLRFRAWRFMIIALLAMLIVFGSTYIEVPLLDDDSVFGYVCFFVWMIISWPLFVAEALVQWLPAAAKLPVGIVASGLLWASIVEGILRFRKQRALNQPIQPTPR